MLPLRHPDDELWLAFQPALSGLRTDLSAVEWDPQGLWLASDEGSALERLTAAPGGWEHRRYDLARPFRLPDAGPGEADVEGLCRDGDRLWLAGSHSLRRRVAADGMPARGLDWQANRALLGVTDVSEALQQGRLRRRDSSRLPDGDDGLRGLVAADGLLRRFLDLPAKENGFDIEGLAVRDDVVLLGLRGPVLAGLAVVLELRVGGIEAGRITLDRGRHGPLRTHLLDLGGLGIRDMSFHAGRLLLLAGPTMALDGSAAVFSWDWRRRAEAGRVPEGQVRPLFAIPTGVGEDHPEGIAAEPNGARLLVVHDSPAAARLARPNSVRADLFAL